jgi:oligopeptide transport system substrate-binding protein
MSKLSTCMHQVAEKPRIATEHNAQPFEFLANLVQCGVFLGITASLLGCGPDKGDAGANHSASGGTHSVTDARTLKRGLPGEPRTLDPQLADDTFSLQVTGDLYEGLTTEDRRGEIVPGAAQSWTVDNTGTIYTFQLRPNAKWSDGTQVVSTEFVEGLRRAVDPKTASGSAALLSVIRGASAITAGHANVTDLGATAINESSIRIVLEHPAPFILQILAQPVASPVHIVQQASSTESRQQTNLASNGPYILVKRVPNSFIELARNPDYWDAGNVAIPTVRYINSESEATELREYIAGDLDMTFTIPMPDFKRISEQYGKEVQTAPILATLYLALNLSAPPLKDSVTVRQALSMAIDREAIADHVMMGVAPAYSFVAEGVTGYRLPEYDWSKWSRGRQLSYARDLLEHAGYSAKKPLHLRLYYNRDEGIQRIMVAVAGGWKQNLGVESELISDEFRVFLAGRKDHSHWDVARIGWNADYDDPASFLDVFAESEEQNDPGYNSDKFNRLVDESRVEPEPERRLDLLRQSEQVLLADYPIIPIYFYKARRLVKPYLGGAEISPMNHCHSKHLYWIG